MRDFMTAVAMCLLAALGLVLLAVGGALRRRREP